MRMEFGTRITTRQQRLRAQLAIASVSLIALAACGDGGSDTAGSPPPPPPPPPATTTNLDTRVVDGPIGNALVCLDINGNGGCDGTEPQGRTAADGRVRLTIEQADVGRYPIVAQVGADAVDADSGAVTTAYILQAPAANSAVVSPLTTLVQQEVSQGGLPMQAATEAVRAQLALNVDPLADYSGSNEPVARTAGVVARLLVSMVQQQNAALAAAIGTTDASGATISASEINRTARNLVRLALADISSAAADPATAQTCATLSAPACTSAIQTQAQALVSATGVTAANVGVAVAAARSVDASADVVEPTAALRTLRYGDVNNYAYRVNLASSAENSPDGSNLSRYRDYRVQREAGVLETWRLNDNPLRQGDLHWTGSQWASCALNVPNTALRAASGRIDYNYCDRYELGYSFRFAPLDLSGRTYAQTLTLLRDLEAAPADRRWGTPPALFAPGNDPDPIVAALGAGTMPAGSRLWVQQSLSQTHALAYDIRDANRVSVFSAQTVAGGDNRSGQIAACNLSTPPSSLATTLETLIAGARGSPCIQAEGTINGVDANGAATTYASGTPNEGWGATTFSLGTLGTAPTGAPVRGYYSANTALRVAFAGSSPTVMYYACRQRWSDGGVRNCAAIGLGTYTIETLGDARVLTFGSLPTRAAALGYDRVFIERGGFVYYGYRSRPTTTLQARLNLVAANAILTRLGIPALTP